MTTTNHRNPEKDCLTYENMLQTVRLTMLDGFSHDEPDITAKLKGLASAAPTLFSVLLPREGLGRTDLEDEDDPSIGARVVDDMSHPDARVLVLVKARVYKAMGFPVREGELSLPFANSATRCVSSRLWQEHCGDFELADQVVEENLVWR